MLCEECLTTGEGDEPMAHPSFYGFLSNSYTSALVSPDGVIEWFPCPRFDSHAIFVGYSTSHEGDFLVFNLLYPFTAAKLTMTIQTLSLRLSKPSTVSPKLKIFYPLVEWPFGDGLKPKFHSN